MKTVQARFIKSAVQPEDYPQEPVPEVVMIGRSNAGKSSLINALCGRKSLAQVSRTPGKTRLINFFDVGGRYRLVDLPGYGFAARGRDERRQWARMIETFLLQRDFLCGLLLICDVRRRWTPDEDLIVDLAAERELPWLCALNKSDKLNRKQFETRMKLWPKEAQLNDSYFMPISASKKTGIEELGDRVFQDWVRPWSYKDGR